MCGIAGIFRDPGRPAPSADEIRPALRAMAHRGPDDEQAVARGRFALGVRRLAIVDREGGAQPMPSPTGALFAMNGEVHDYLEHRARLRAEGAYFSSRGDTEVLLRLFERGGPEALSRVTGMFAFAWCDPVNGVLALGRDPFGVKPLLYVDDPERGEVRFASDLSGLLSLPGGRPRLDLDALCERLAFQSSIGDRTLVAGVRSVPPGCVLRFSAAGEGRERRYHDVVYQTETGRSEGSWTEEVRAEVTRAVRLALRAEVPVGLTLSGGLDSGLVAGAAALAQGPGLPAFTGYFDEGPDFDERPHARRAAAEAGLRLTEVRVAAQDFARGLRPLAVALEGPVAGPGSLAQAVTVAKAAESVTVLLTGQGADETFGGYARHRLAVLALGGRLDPDSLPPDLVPYAPLARRLRGIGGSLDDVFFHLVHRGDGAAPLLGEALAERFAAFDARERFAGLFRREDGDPFHRMASFERRTLLPALLHVEDRVAMARSVESRVPLLSPALVDLSARVPPEIAFDAGEGKRILRRAARGVAPAGAVERRDKKGFPVPVDLWARGVLRSEILRRLREGPLVAEGLLAPDAPERLVDGAGGHGRHLWFFLILSEWMAATGLRP